MIYGECLLSGTGMSDLSFYPPPLSLAGKAGDFRAAPEEPEADPGQQFLLAAPGGAHARVQWYGGWFLSVLRVEGRRPFCMHGCRPLLGALHSLLWALRAA